MRARTNSKSLWAIGFPIIIAGVSETIIDVTDAIFLGRYGIIELGAVALADAVYIMAVVVAIGLADGIQVVIARRAGEGKREDIGRTFGQGMYLLTIASVLLFALIRFASPHVTSAIVSSDEVRSAVDAFLQVIAFAVIFDALNFGFSAFYVGIGRTKVLIWTTALLALTNIVLDYGLIFGNLGLPELGIRGAAIASLSAEIVALTFLTLYTWLNGYAASYGLFSVRRWDRRAARVLLDVSYPVVLEGFVASVRWFIFFVIIEQLGNVALAASNVVYSCYVVLLVPLNGLAEAVSTLVGNLIGRGKANQIGVPIRKGISLGFTVTTPLLIVAVVAPEWVLSLFTSDESVVAAAVPSLLVVVAAILVAIPGENLLAGVYGTADTKATFGIELMVSTVALTYAYLTALQLDLALHIIWSVEILGWAISSIVAYLWLRSEAWRRVSL